MLIRSWLGRGAKPSAYHFPTLRKKASFALDLNGFLTGEEMRQLHLPKYKQAHVDSSQRASCGRLRLVERELRRVSSFGALSLRRFTIHHAATVSAITRSLGHGCEVKRCMLQALRSDAIRAGTALALEENLRQSLGEEKNKRCTDRRSLVLKVLLVHSLGRNLFVCARKAERGC